MMVFTWRIRPDYIINQPPNLACIASSDIPIVTGDAHQGHWALMVADFY